MKCEALALPEQDNLVFPEVYPWVLCLDDQQARELNAVLPGHLVALKGGSSVNLYIDDTELGFSYAGITDARLVINKNDAQGGFISLEVTSVRSQSCWSILKITPFSESGLAWFINNKKLLAGFIGQQFKLVYL